MVGGKGDDSGHAFIPTQLHSQSCPTGRAPMSDDHLELSLQLLTYSGSGAFLVGAPMTISYAGEPICPATSMYQPHIHATMDMLN